MVVTVGGGMKKVMIVGTEALNVVRGKLMSVIKYES